MGAERRNPPIDRTLVLGKKLFEQSLRRAEPLVRKDNGLGLANRIRNVTLLVKPVQRSPIKRLPRPRPAMKRQIKQGENRVVNLLFVVVHAVHIPSIASKYLGTATPGYTMIHR